MANGLETTAVPISDRITRDICCKIVNGECKKGEKLPSVREMAAKWSVSPDTIQRSYAQLERFSLIEAEHGLGTFVTEDESWIKRFRHDLMWQKIDAFVADMKEMGVLLPEIIDALELKAAGKEEKTSINSTDGAEKFLADFEQHAQLDENGNYALIFRNEVDYLSEEVWTTLFKSEGKWYFHSHGNTWTGLRAKEIPDAVQFVLKYAKALPL